MTTPAELEADRIATESVVVAASDAWADVESAWLNLNGIAL